jgi:Cys-tRNA(Pro) deacylase
MSRPSRADRAATAATRLLDALEVPHTVHRYRYEEHGGTRVASRELDVDEHTVIKTLVMEDENRRPLVVLMHGDREVATGRLARQVGCKRVTPCAPDVATRHSGYLVGGTSPFGLRKPLAVFMERTILELPRVFVNGGSRGLLLEIAPADLDRVLKPTLVAAAAGVSGL